VIIPAGGAGKRMGSKIAKQFLLLHEIPVLARTLNVFQSCTRIDEIVLVVPESQLYEVKKSIVDPFEFRKVSSIVPGGPERQDSVKNGLSHVSGGTEFILIHDAVRPFISVDDVIEVLEAARDSGAAVMGIPVSDTLKRVTEDQIIISTVDRGSIWLTQTPQVFRAEVIREAYRLAYNDGYYATDDSTLVEKLGVAVKIIHGSPFNIKITTHADMITGEKILMIPGMDSFAGRVRGN